MASLKEVKDKIASVRKTKQITRAMNMVASAKLRKAQGRIERFRPYAEKYYEIMGDLSQGVDSSAHPLLEQREEINNIAVVLVTSERGLCGAFNSNLVQTATNFAANRVDSGQNVKFYCMGKKGAKDIKKSPYELVSDHSDVMENFDFTLASQIGAEIIHAYTQQEVDEVHLVYGRFVSVIRQEATRLQILPMSQEGGEEQSGEQSGEQAGSKAEYTYEPSVEGILDELLPRFIKVQLYRGLLETSASEHAARMTAMDNATRNCDDMISNLTLSYNKARQAAITSELLDIVGGAEALKG
ncbi:MAG: F0F1 ATP synthase subunit gamma [Desulfohalobiaceae bacterium]|nr:F0F1 ATP synthase subunit gamma [Desulfohalobiaceae bacterium]